MTQSTLQFSSRELKTSCLDFDLEKRQSQKEEILYRLLRGKENNINGGWVDGQTEFLHNMYISQYHARIWELEKEGYLIESRVVGWHNWKEYKIS